MPFRGFHPLVQRWFTDCVGTPTAAQQRGWGSIAAGRHTLISAPTGSGKTLAAFLSAIDGLTREGVAAPLRDEVRVLRSLSSADVRVGLEQTHRIPHPDRARADFAIGNREEVVAKPLSHAGERLFRCLERQASYE